MGFLQGKRALIVGIASERSIATGIAEAMHREGAELAFSYQNDRLQIARRRCREGIRIVASCCPATYRLGCRNLDALFANRSRQHWGKASMSSCTRSDTPRAKSIQGDFLDSISRQSLQHRA
jgi:enoyl-[acyl-carrier protein] reductase I